MKSAVVGLLLLNSIGVTNADALVLCVSEPIAPMCRLSGGELTVIVEADGEKEFVGDSESAVKIASLSGKALIAKMASQLVCLRNACSTNLMLVPQCTIEASAKSHSHFELSTKNIQWRVICETKDIVRSQAEWKVQMTDVGVLIDEPR